MFFFFYLLERLIVPSFQNCWKYYLFIKYLRCVFIRVSHKFLFFSSYEMDTRYLFYSSSSSSISLIILKIVGAYLQNISMMFVVEESVLHHLFPSLFIIPSFQNLFAKYSSAFLLGYFISFFLFLRTKWIHDICSALHHLLPSLDKLYYILFFQNCWSLFAKCFYDVCSSKNYSFSSIS